MACGDAGLAVPEGTAGFLLTATNVTKITGLASGEPALLAAASGRRAGRLTAFDVL